MERGSVESGAGLPFYSIIHPPFKQGSSIEHTRGLIEVMLNDVYTIISMKKRKHISGFSWNKRKTIALIIIIVIVVPWGFFYSYSSEKYGQQYSIMLTALLIASIAAVANLLSLQWSRDTVRPFLFHPADTIQPEQVKTNMKISFKIHNSGSLPATNIEVDIDIFASDEEVTEDNISNRFKPATALPIMPMLLPNSHYTATYILNLKDKDDLAQWEAFNQGKAKVRLRISYESMNRKHVTIQTEELSKPEWESRVVFAPIPPQKWK